MAGSEVDDSKFWSWVGGGQWPKGRNLNQYMELVWVSNSNTEDKSKKNEMKNWNMAISLAIFLG